MKSNGYFLCLIRCLACGTGIGISMNPAHAQSKPSPLIISEVMAKPVATSVEWIELYNPNNHPLSLNGYTLAMGSRADKLIKRSLESLPELEPHTHLVLTLSPTVLLSTYPEADPSLVSGFPLPTLNNNGHHIVLLHGDVVIDQLHYRPSLMDKGLRSKYGISLERTEMNLSSQAETRIWRSALKQFGYATPTAPNSRVIGSTHQEQDEDALDLDDIRAVLRSDKMAWAEVVLYDLHGQRLAIIGRNESLAWMDQLATSPVSALNMSRMHTDGVLLLSIHLNRSDGTRDHYALKYQIVRAQ